MTKKPHVNIGTIGYVRHGERTLKEAIELAMGLEESIQEHESEDKIIARLSKNAIIVVNEGGLDSGDHRRKKRKKVARRARRRK